MVHKPEKKNKHCTTPDHRPMCPEFRAPGDTLDTAVREARRRRDDANPHQHMLWR